MTTAIAQGDLRSRECLAHETGHKVPQGQRPVSSQHRPTAHDRREARNRRANGLIHPRVTRRPRPHENRRADDESGIQPFLPMPFGILGRCPKLV